MIPKLIAKIILKAEQKWTPEVAERWCERKLTTVFKHLYVFAEQVQIEYYKLKTQEPKP